MKINRTLLTLGTLGALGTVGAVAGAGCLGLYAVRRIRAARIDAGRTRVKDRRGSAPNALLSGTLAGLAREFFPWNPWNMGNILAARLGRNLDRSPRSLAGKVVLITGGSRGFGLALAEEFASHGARIALIARDADELERARKKLLVLGLREQDVTTFPCDLTDEEQTRKMIARATEEFGQIDILVNNAGIISVGPVENQPVSAFKSAIESNYYTMLHATLALLPQMLARGSGNIVNVASVGGKLAVPHLLPYSASKFAALGFSQGLHAELRAKGICVTSVCPGLMRTGSHTQALFTGDREREYRWFSLAASLPCVSTSARAAAKKVVHATAEGRTEIAITPQAFLAATFAQALPECTATVMHWVNSQVLPQPLENTGSDMAPGKDVRGKELTPLMQWGRNAAQRYNQV